MKKIFLIGIVLAVIFSCSTGTGDAYIFVEGIANTSLSTGIELYTEKTNIYTNDSTGYKTTHFYIAITDIKIKARGEDWITLRETYSLPPEEMVRGVNLVNGFPVSAKDYNIILIGYMPNWYILTETTNLTNSTSTEKKYAIFYNDTSVYNEISSQYSSSPSFYWNSTLSLFAGDRKTIYIKFDTEYSLRGFTNSGGEITNAFFIPPKIYIEVR